MKKATVFIGLMAAPLLAQGPLSLQEAVHQALTGHPSIQAASEQVAAAEQRIRQAHGGYLPQVNYTESAASSNNPVFVFSSLLMQRRFSESNFQVGTLNRPDFTENYSSQVSVDQMVYDFGRLKSQRQGAELGKKMTAEQRRLAEMGVIAGVVRTYYGEVLAREALAVAREALKSAEADQQRAETVRAAGMATDADVLSVGVHVASVKEQEIQKNYDLQVAQAALNEALGLPLDAAHDLTTPLAAVPLGSLQASAYEDEALKERPELRQTTLSAKLAETQLKGAKAERLPTIGAHAAFEVDRGNFFSNGGANWTFAAQLKWNLFDGFRKQARIAEASHQLSGARAVEKQMTQGIRLQVRKAWADLHSAEERIAVAESSVSMAAESQRITRNRYESGMATVTDLLRTDTALLDSRTRRLAAVYDQRVAAAMLELASGTLTGDSDVLK